jgi:hypothetical protein
MGLAASTGAQPTAPSENARGAVALFFDGLPLGLVVEGERCVRSTRAECWAWERQSESRRSTARPVARGRPSVQCRGFEEMTAAIGGHTGAVPTPRERRRLWPYEARRRDRAPAPRKGFALTYLLEPWVHPESGDLFLYRGVARLTLDGQLPYRDFFLEYPPLSVPLMVAPGLAATGDEYFRAFAAGSVVLAACLALLSGARADQTGGNRRAALVLTAGAPIFLGGGFGLATTSPPQS